ncbi:TPA: hypothetical protein DCW38_05035 [candidate division WOR-3 bacterium]|uniref:Uncharacterized protein n=1 Tax=candidate division WOR-3 bacterium TaxID=2052148 RepID=A0A350HAG3_UNCW3|nr:hypothetical protein [candidate division WOR-3 bacterium]
MKKSSFFFLITLLIILIFAFILFLNFNKRLFSVNGATITEDYVEQYKRIYMLSNNIDSIYSTSVAFEIIKDLITEDLCKKAGINISDSTYEAYSKMLKNDKSSSFLIDSLEKILGSKNTYKYFLKPFIAENLLADKISNDMNFIQKERYSKSLAIYKSWKGRECQNELLSDSVEYFIKSLSPEDEGSDMNIQKDSINMYEDNNYYYVSLFDGETNKGYRIRKVEFEEFALNYSKNYKIHFYDQSYMRAFKLLSENSIWEKLTDIK